MNAPAERRQQLLGIKLHALVRDHLGRQPDAENVPFALGAALVGHREAWVLVDEAPEASLGRVLAWAAKAGADTVHVLAERATGTLARQAASFAMAIDVWHVDDRTLLPAVAEPLPQPPPVPAEHLAFRSVITDAGAEPVIEHGVLAGEVRGLEVCRAVTDPFTGSHRLEVGVGAHDREAFQLLNGDVPPVEALASVVAAVDQYRRPGAAPHPLNRLAAERLLRWQLVRHPSAVSASELHVAEPPLPRPNVKDPVPCVARGTSVDGTSLVAVCSTGIDLSLVPTAVDARLSTAAERCVVVVRAADRSPVTERLASLAVPPVEVAVWDGGGEQFVA